MCVNIEDRMKNISWRVFFIPLSLIYPLLIILNVFRNELYYFISFFISGLILIWNFPKLAFILSSRPIYFDDLSLENEEKEERLILLNIESTKKFQNIYIIIQQFILSLSLALIIDYGVIEYKNKNMNFTDILIAIGGLGSLYTKIIYYIGKMLVSILYFIKKKQKQNIISNLL